MASWSLTVASTAAVQSAKSLLQSWPSVQFVNTHGRTGNTSDYPIKSFSLKKPPSMAAKASSISVLISKQVDCSFNNIPMH